MTRWGFTVCALASALIMCIAIPASILAHEHTEPATELLNIQPALIYQLELTSDVGDGLRLVPSLSEPTAIIGAAGTVFKLSAATDDGLSKDTWATAPTLDIRIRDARIQPGEADAATISHELEDFDPWERFNGKTFEFNRRVDKYALKPVAKGWKTVVPERAGIMISNAFDNVTVVPRVVNNVLQGKWNGAGRELSRFLINSTAGVGGLFDPAKDVWHITKSPADFGQTLGKWGAEPGPYLVLPFMEPLTVRDGIGKLVDRAMDPLSYVVPLIPALILVTGNRVNERALNYELFEDFDAGVIDAYAAVRNGYLQQRERMLNE
jgi:phospholipid-binding lipoprotein MlaA